jgi:homoserine O-succinyltransferase
MPMPVHVNSNRSSQNCQANAMQSLLDPSHLPEQLSRCVTIGLINNMSEGAFNATERQFISLLNSASKGVSIYLSLYTLTGIPGMQLDGCDAGSCYSNVDTLWSEHLDGLIVTGREPTTPDLRDEPYWGSFTKVLGWAKENTLSTIWSCLAAHAAVLHADGIGRQKSDHKHSGIYKCEPVASHQLTEGVSSNLQIPHSRWNGVDEEELAVRGYDVLTRTSDAGVDAFVKKENSLFVFFQGHPEYESDTLLREYRRDVGRYLRYESNVYPLTPRSYFDSNTEDALATLREQALSNRSTELLCRVATVSEQTTIENTWQFNASCIYRNWLNYICAQKSVSLPDGQANAACSISR